TPIATPGYNKMLVLGENPLAGRPAYGGTSPGYPATSMVTLDFGTHLANMAFKLRFRVGSDTNTGGPGWEIDNLAFTGLVGTPFPTLVASTDTCGAGSGGPETVGGNAGGCQIGGAGSGSAGLALGVLAMLLRRRRR